MRIDNFDEDTIKEAGKLWGSLFQNGIYNSITNKKNSKTIGLYTNYGKELKGDCDYFACVEVNDTEGLPKNVEIKTIDSGKYAKFVISGDVSKEVVEFWNGLWKLGLDRKYSFDFEENQGDDCHGEGTETHIYISLK